MTLIDAKGRYRVSGVVLSCGGSSNGRTPDSGSGYLGSNPSPPAKAPSLHSFFSTVPSSSGLGYRPLTPATRVRTPLGPPAMQNERVCPRWGKPFRFAEAAFARTVLLRKGFCCTGIVEKHQPKWGLQRSRPLRSTPPSEIVREAFADGKPTGDGVETGLRLPDKTLEQGTGGYRS
jgi:hypothetical protein